ncbi:MAG: hypothetical protein ACXQS8_06775 [Candidatus Helarchaeales archaeon]
MLAGNLVEREVVYIKFFQFGQLVDILLDRKEEIETLTISTSDVIPCNYVCEMRIGVRFSFIANRGLARIEIKKINEEVVKELEASFIKEDKTSSDFVLAEIHFLRGGTDINLGYFDCTNAEIEVTYTNTETRKMNITIDEMFPLSTSFMLKTIKYQSQRTQNAGLPTLLRNMEFWEFVRRCKAQLVLSRMGEQYKLIECHVLPATSEGYLEVTGTQSMIHARKKSVNAVWREIQRGFTLDQISENGTLPPWNCEFEIIPRRNSVLFGSSIFEHANRSEQISNPNPSLPRIVNMGGITINVDIDSMKYRAVPNKRARDKFDVRFYISKKQRILEEIDVYDVLISSYTIETDEGLSIEAGVFIVLEVVYRLEDGKITMDLKMMENPSLSIDLTFVTNETDPTKRQAMYEKITKYGITIRPKLDWTGTPWKIKVKQMIDEKIGEMKNIGAGEIFDEKSSSFYDRIREFILDETLNIENLREDAPVTEDSTYINSIPTSPFAGEGYGLVIPRYRGDKTIIKSIDDAPSINFIGECYWTKESDIPDHQDGDWLLHTKNHQSQELFDENGNHVLEAKSIKLNASPLEKRTRPSPTSEGNVEIDGNQVKLGKNATNGVARINDQIQITMSSDPSNLTSLSLLCIMFGLPFTAPLKGLITQGSNKVKSE